MRDLEYIEYFSSYNNAGRYYTLKDNPVFNDLGLWFYQDAHFSKYGKLEPTVLNIANNSKFGKTPKELQSLLDVQVYNVSINLFKKKEISRKKLKVLLFILIKMKN